MDHLSKRLSGYLKSWHRTSTNKKREQGLDVNLTFGEFVALFTPNQILRLEWEIAKNSLRVLQNATSEEALVLTWRNYSALKSKRFDRETAYICPRSLSENICQMKAGDIHTDEARQKMSAASKGKPKSEAHKAATSAACKGVKKQPWSEERKAARRAQIAAKKLKQGASK